jgi:hypothetical protein
MGLFAFDKGIWVWSFIFYSLISSILIGNRDPKGFKKPLGFFNFQHPAYL